MNDRCRVLDGELVRSRRIDLQFGETAFARATGLTVRELQRLERGEAQDHLTLRQVQAIAATLSLKISDMLTEPVAAPDMPAPEHMTDIGALLATTPSPIHADAFCLALDMTSAALDSTLDSVDRVIRPAGMAVARTRDGISLTSAKPIQPERSEAVHRDVIAIDHLEADIAQIILEAVHGREPGRLRGTAGRRLTRLARAGIIRFAEPDEAWRITITDAVRYSLRLDDRPTSHADG